MTGDVEALKSIREKEDSVEAEIREFARKQEEMLEQKRKELAGSVESAKTDA